jgi:hypothetical protein
MRTDLTTEINGVRIRGVVSALSWGEMIPKGMDFLEWQRALTLSDPRITRLILMATMKAAGDLSPLEIGPAVDGLMERLPLRQIGELHCLRLIEDALDKVEGASKNSHAAEAPETATAAEPTSTTP